MTWPRLTYVWRVKFSQSLQARSRVASFDWLPSAWDVIFDSREGWSVGGSPVDLRGARGMPLYPEVCIDDRGQIFAIVNSLLLERGLRTFSFDVVVACLQVKIGGLQIWPWRRLNYHPIRPAPDPSRLRGSDYAHYKKRRRTGRRG